MEPIKTTLFHLIREPAARAGDTLHPGLILLHGRGADEEDLFGLTPFLDDRLFVLSVRAPYPFPMSGGFTWFEMNSLGIPDMDMYRRSRSALSAFIDDALRGYPIDAENLFLFGFSMGTMMAFTLSLTDPRMFKGVVAHSGFVPEHPSLTPPWSGLEGAGFFIAHGTYDPVIPVHMARRTRDLFERSDASWEYREYPIGHEISQESISDASAWVRSRLGRS